MKKLIILLLMLCFMSNSTFADCDFATGITPGPNHTFIYSEACHQKMGKLVEDNKTQAEQIDLLTKAIADKNAALFTADSRTKLWMDSAASETDRLTKIQSDNKTNEYWAFGLGVLATIGAGYVAAQVYKHQ